MLPLGHRAVQLGLLLLLFLGRQRLAIAFQHAVIRLAVNHHRLPLLRLHRFHLALRIQQPIRLPRDPGVVLHVLPIALIEFNGSGYDLPCLLPQPRRRESAGQKSRERSRRAPARANCSVRSAPTRATIRALFASRLRDPTGSPPLSQTARSVQATARGSAGTSDDAPAANARRRNPRPSARPARDCNAP